MPFIQTPVILIRIHLSAHFTVILMILHPLKFIDSDSGLDTFSWFIVKWIFDYVTKLQIVFHVVNVFI